MEGVTTRGDGRMKTIWSVATTLSIVVGVTGAGLDRAPASAATASPDVAVLLRVADVHDLNVDDVRAVVMPTSASLSSARSGVLLKTWPVPAAAIQASGETVRVALAPEAVPAAYLDRSGVVNFQISVIDGQRTGLWQTSAQAASVNGTAQWVSLDTVVGRAAARSGAKLPAVARVNAADGPRPVQMQTMSLDDPGARSVVPRGASHQWLTPDQCQQIKTEIYLRTAPNPIIIAKKTVRPWASLASLYPTAGDRAWFTYDHQAGGGFESSFGIAASVEPNLFEFHVSGTSKVTNSAGYGYESPHATYAQAIRTQVKYRKLVEWRLPMPPPYGDGQPFDCNKPFRTVWVPVAHMGNFLPKTGLVRPHWTHCVKEGRGTWWRSRANGHEWHNSAGVKIAGVIGFDLQSNHQYTTESKVAYAQRHTEWLCGNNARPILAGKIMESTTRL